MSLFSRLKDLFRRATKHPAAEPASAGESSKRFIEFFDANGTRLLIDREEYHARVLPQLFTNANNDPEELYSLIVHALNEGFTSTCVAPARRLVEIDPSSERNQTILGISLLKNQLIDDAEAQFTHYINERGESGIILLNLAKVYAEQGRADLAEQKLWKSLTLDPNIANAVDWYAAIARERGGEAAYLQALRAIAAIPGSWQPQLWLARHDLEQGRKDEALAIYREVLPCAKIAWDALMMISGDLGNNGYSREALDLVLPVFDIRLHSYMPALNLIQACVQLRDRQTGRRLLAEVRNLNRPDLAQHVQYFEQALANA